MIEFKIRASATHEIIGNAMNRPTEIQMARLAELQAKPKRTDKQEEELIMLIAKRDTKLPLSAGAITYCENWVKENLYERRMEFTSKYTDKGTTQEPGAIELAAEVQGWGLVSKNDQWFENSHMTGTPDIILANSVEDIKCSWSCWTFPLFDTKLPHLDYFWQLTTYLELTGKESANVNYCLMDAPEHLIDREARSVSFAMGLSEVSMEIYDEVARKMTYSHLDKKLRFKSFPVVREQKAIDAIYERVEMCREFIDSLIKQLG